MIRSVGDDGDLYATEMERAEAALFGVRLWQYGIKGTSNYGKWTVTNPNMNRDLLAGTKYTTARGALDAYIDLASGNREARDV